MGYIGVICTLICAVLSGIRRCCCDPTWRYHEVALLPAALILFSLHCQSVSVQRIASYFFSGFGVSVFISNGRHYKIHLLSFPPSSKQEECISQTAAAFTIEFECHAFSARLVWLSTDRELCWIPFLSSCFNQCELAPLSYFMRGDFSASPLCWWFWLPLPSLVFKRWILVLTRELTLLPSLSPGCRPACFTWLDIPGHMLMRITLSEREDAGCIYRCFQNEAQWQEYYTGPENLFDPVHSHRDESWEWLYILPLSLKGSLYAVILQVISASRWQRSSCATYSFRYMGYTWGKASNHEQSFTGFLFSFHW